VTWVFVYYTLVTSSETLFFSSSCTKHCLRDFKTVKLAERLKQVVSHVTSILPSSLSPASMVAHPNDGEEQRYQQEIEEVKQWWTDSRWRHTRRPFTAEQIVSKRGNLKIEYPSNAMAKKLWSTVEERFAVRFAVLFTKLAMLMGSRTTKQALPMAAWTQ